MLCRVSLSIELTLHCRKWCVEPVRRVSGAARRKPKILPIKRLKTPSMLALDHFDFYYGPLYDKKWPSIRLGLLSPNKFVAVLNRFSKEYELNERILREAGTFNLIERITGGSKPPSERVQAMRRQSQAHFDALLQSNVSEEFAANTAVSPPANPFEEGDNEPDGLMLRAGADALNVFGGEKNTFALNEVKDRAKHNSKRIIRDSEFKVTGLEGMGRSSLKLMKDIIYYPRGLNLQVFARGVLDDFPGPIRDSYGISSWWLLDGGSVLPVLALDLHEKDNVLDMCAAPGGKSLMIVQSQNFHGLTCNDLKLTRLGQLRRGLAMYVPDNCKEASRIIIKRKDASSVENWDELDVYDKVLLDAPCSTDRVSANQDDNSLFLTENTTQRLNLPILQTRLLINALRSVRVGGSVVYSTCTLSPTQNESVVENAVVLADQYYGIGCVEQSLTQMRDQLQTTGIYRFSSICRHGLLVLPTILSNFGPMYVCKLKRLR